ncbi:MAG: efflux transporter outer membrane subunit [Silvibacterium sp.]|nr:efflux transporter outer membrane subunit [Silvibacterium sp.]
MKRLSAIPVCPALVALAFCGVLCGCLPGPRYQKPAAPAATAPAYKESPANFQNTEGWKVAQPQEGMLRGKWWEIFNDPDLNALEDQLEINNQNIKVSFENYMAARAVIREDKAQLWPTVTTAPAWSRSRSSSNLFNTSQANTGHESTIWSFPVDVSWTPDFFGKIRSQIHEAQYGAQVSAADLAVERLLEQATLAQIYFQIRGQDELQRVLNATVETDRKALELTQTQYETGIGNFISVVQARTTLQTVESEALNIGVSRAQYEHAIAMLLGKPASEFSIPVKPLLVIPPPVPIGVPSQLLERRPDIAAAERTLAEGNATIGIGYGAFFPTVTLSAAGGFQASQAKHWFDWPSRFWSIGPQLSQTLFNGGLYRAALQQYTAQYNANVATYRQTVLTAFQQVEDYLAATRILSEQLIKQKQAVQSSQEYLDLEMYRYQSGIDPYLDVTIAQNTLLSNQQSLTTLNVQEEVAAVELIQALGGGWDVSQLPTTAQVSEKPAKGTYDRQK